MKYLMVMSGLLLALAAFSSSGAFAEDENSVPNNIPAPAVVQQPAPAAPVSRSGRSKSLSFDDSVVEGLNQNSKDSLEMVEKNGGKARQHLYQKKSDFKKEIQNFPSELGYSP